MMRYTRRFALLLAITLVAIHPTLAAAVDVDYNFYANNDVIIYDPNATDPCFTTSAGTKVRGNDNVAKMWNYFIDKGLSNEQAAGILGNIQQESGFSPFRQEDSQGWPGGGYGIVQWTGSRRTEIVGKMRTGLPEVFPTYYSANFGKATSEKNGYVPEGVDIGVNDNFLSFELDYLHQESTTRKVRDGYGPSGATEWEAIKAAKTVREASDVWLYSFERPGDQSESHAAKRAGFGEKILEKMKSQSTGQTAAPTAGGTTTNPSTAPTPTTSTPQTSEISATGKGVIAIDPGHNGTSTSKVDEKTGIKMIDYSNPPEDKNVFTVAQRVKAKLEKVGYTVVMLKTSVDEDVTYRQRVDRALGAKAALAVSIHSTPKPGKSTATPQHVGDYRMQSPGSSKKITFDNKDTADKSQAYAKAIAQERTKVEAQSVSTDSLSFEGRSGLAGGNIPNIMLIADTLPWVYNEIVADNASNAMSEKTLESYAEGISKGIIAANPTGAGATEGGCSGGSFAGGDLAATTLAYAWPEYKGRGFTETRPAYRDAVKKAMSEGLYVGGTIDYCLKQKGIRVADDSVDCGGFVTRLVINSGLDPGYNYKGKGGPTGDQERWAKENWQSLGSGVDAATLKPGDVAFSPGHTFIFVGDIAGFGSKIASASLCSRAPMAGKETITSGDTNWYRKK